MRDVTTRHPANHTRARAHADLCGYLEVELKVRQLVIPKLVFDLQLNPKKKKKKKKAHDGCSETRGTRNQATTSQRATRKPHQLIQPHDHTFWRYSRKARSSFASTCSLVMV